MTKDEQTSKLLERKYGITLAEYNQLLEAQFGGCAICGSRPKTRRLHVDHDHRVTKLKISTQKNAKGRWYSWAKVKFKDGPFGGIPAAVHDTRKGAVRAVRETLKRLSIRGLLCFPCNAGLRKYSDSPSRLHSAGTYLAAFNMKRYDQLERP